MLFLRELGLHIVALLTKSVHVYSVYQVNSTSVPVLVQWVLRHIQTVGTCMHPKAAYSYSLSRKHVIGVLL